MFTLCSRLGSKLHLEEGKKKRAMLLTPGSTAKWKDELQLQIKSLKWNIGRWQRTGCIFYFYFLPLRAAAGRSSATSRTAWASHWLGTPSITSPLWQGPCPSWSGSTEVWLWTERRHHSDISFSFFSLPQRSKNYLIKYEALDTVQREKHDGQLKYVEAVKGKKQIHLSRWTSRAEFLNLNMSTLKHYKLKTAPHIICKTRWWPPFPF